MPEQPWRHKHDDGYPDDGRLVEVLYNEPGQPGPVLRRARWNDPALMMWTREPEEGQDGPVEWYHPEHVEEWRPIEAPLETVEVCFPVRNLGELGSLGLNPFAVQLVAESFLSINQLIVDDGQDPLPGVGFELPVERTDCAAFAGIRIYLEPIPRPEVAATDA